MLSKILQISHLHLWRLPVWGSREESSRRRGEAEIDEAC